jgi:AcrR family transcriptional regulator
MLRTYNISTYRFELRQKILQTAMQQFKEMGVKNVKMDDISAIIGISKRTLYEIYENKEELLLEGVKFDRECRFKELQEFVGQKERNEIEVMVKFVKMQMEDLNVINPLFFVEIRRYKRVVNYLQEYNEEQRKNTMLALKALHWMPGDVHLVLVGRPTSYVKQLVACANKDNLASRLHLLHGVPDDDLPAI